MSDPVQQALIPTEVALLTAAQTAFASIFNGAPETAGVRAALAAEKFLGDAGLDVVAGGAGVFQAVGQVVNSKFNDLIAKAKAKETPPA